MRRNRLLWYVADPMCSWCWGFAPVISAIDELYRDQIHIALLMGGLRPGTTESVTDKFRDEILHHWHEVNKRTGQPFKFEGAMPSGFIYDTEPPSRAVVAIGELKPELMLRYFKSLQCAFYAEGQDITQTEILIELAQRQGIDADQFRQRFNDETLKQKTRSHFFQAQHAGITGFPTVLMQDDASVDLLTVGYQPFENLKPKIEAWVNSKHA